MNQKFAERLAEAGWNKSKLIELMNELDSEKRDIKIGLRSIAQDQKFHEFVGAEREYKIHQMKAKERYLIEEREIVRQRIGRLNRELKGMNRAKNREQNFPAAFVAAAEEMLDQESFTELELRAVEILSST